MLKISRVRLLRRRKDARLVITRISQWPRRWLAASTSTLLRGQAEELPKVSGLGPKDLQTGTPFHSHVLAVKELVESCSKTID